MSWEGRTATEIPAEIPIHNSKALKSIKTTMTHGAADLIPAGNKIARTIIAKRIMITSISENPFGQYPKPKLVTVRGLAIRRLLVSRAI